MGTDTPPRTAATRAAGAAALLSLVLSLTLPWGVGSDARYGDEHLYLDYGDRMQDGDVPYRDFYVEYPPGALPVFVAPALVDRDETTAFRTLMAVLWSAAAACATAAAAAAGVRGRRLALVGAATVAYAVVFSPLLLNTYDAWPAALVAAGLLASLARRDGAAGAALGLAVAAKLLPVLLLPVLWLAARRRGGDRRLLAWFLAAGAVVTLPFLVAAPTGLGNSLETQLRRGLHVESVPASAFLVADRLGATVRTAVQAPGSLNVLGATAGAVALVASILLLVATGLAAVERARRGAGSRSTVAAAAAVVAVTLVLGKVLSPQYLTWAVPVVAATASPPAVVLALAAAALSVTFPLGWITPFDLDGEAWWAVLRNALLVVLLAVLWRRLRREPVDEQRVERHHDEIAGDDDERDRPAVGEVGEARGEPDPGQQRGRGCEQPGRPGPYERHRGQQPDDVLGREHLVEGNQPGGRRGRREHELLAPRDAATAPQEPGRKAHGGELEDGRERAHRVGEAAGDVEGVRARRAHPDGMEPERVGGEEQAAAEPLDLQAARELRPEREAEPACGERDEGQRHERRRHDPAVRQPYALPGAPAAVDGDEQGRSQQRGIELRSRAEPEQDPARHRARAHEQEHPAGDERGGPRVEGVERDRPEQERRQPDEHARGGLASHGAVEGAYGEHDRGRRDPEEEQLQQLERQHVVRVVADERGHDEGRQRAGRELEEEVPVGHVAAGDLLAVLPVEAGVGDAAGLEDPVRDDRGGDREHGEAGEQRARPDASLAHARSLVRRLATLHRRTASSRDTPRGGDPATRRHAA